MMRRLFAIASALSLVLCGVVAALWLASYHFHIRYIWHECPDSVGIVSCNGRVQLKRMLKIEGYGFEEGYRSIGQAIGAWERDGVVIRKVTLPGVGWISGGYPFLGSSAPQVPPPTYTWFHQTYYCCYWVPFLFASGLPVLWLLRFVLRPGYRHGHCACCGYDLRASPQRCPECGTPRPAKSPATSSPESRA